MSLLTSATAIDVAILAAAWLLTYLLHSTVLLGGAFALAAKHRRMSLRWQDRLWKFALVGGLATASLQVGLGFEPFGGRVVLSPETAAADATEAAEPGDGEAARAARIEVEEVADQGTNVADAADRSDRSELAEPTVAPVPRERAPLMEPALIPSDAGPLATTARRATRSERTDLPRGVPRGRGSLHRVASNEPAAAPPPVAERSRPASEDRASFGAVTEPAPAARGLLAGEIAGRPWMIGLWALWLVGAAVGLFAFARALARLRAHLAERVVLDDGPLRARLDALSERAGVRGTIRLTASPRIAAPLTHGMLRREICVPTRALTDLSPAQQEAMLGHELGHAIRRDPTWLGLCWMLERVLLVQPLNRVARARLAQNAEMLCDDWSVHLTGRRLSLASCLTEVAQWVVGTPRALAVAGVTAGMAGAPLTRRVERLLDAAPREVGHRGERWWLAVGLAGLGVVAGAAPGFAAGWRVPSAAPVDSARGDVALPARANELAPKLLELEPAPFDLHATEPLGSADEPDPLALAFDEAMASLATEFELLSSELRDLKRAAAASGGVERFAPRLQELEQSHRALAAQLEAFQDLLPRALASVRAAQSTRPSPELLSPSQRIDSQ